MNIHHSTKYWVIVLGILSGFAQGLTPTNPYQEEFKEFKNNRSPKALLDRKRDREVRNLIVDIDHANEVGFWGRVLRSGLLTYNAVIPVSKDEMPHLHSYIQTVCQQLNMRIPTLYLTKNKTGFLSGATPQSDSTKWLMSAGAILIGQDLLLDVSQNALEAAIAHELCRIKNNHDNKEWLANWVIPPLVGPVVHNVLQGQNLLVQKGGIVLGPLLLSRLLFGKRLEKQADRFVYETQNNAEGLIELCIYRLTREQNIDTDYNEAYELLQNSNSSIFDYVANGFFYVNYRTLHRMGKLWRWLKCTTIIGSNASYQARIDAAQKYLDRQGLK